MGDIKGQVYQLHNLKSCCFFKRDYRVLLITNGLHETAGRALDMDFRL
jgi:hypothetical protein